jgi:hypothetical protein
LSVDPSQPDLPRGLRRRITDPTMRLVPISEWISGKRYSPVDL